mgnify:CR=1 FL=1
MLRRAHVSLFAILSVAGFLGLISTPRVHADKLTIVEYYFAVGCPACAKMADYLKDFKIDGVEIVGYAVGASEDAAKAYAKETGLKFPVRSIPREDALFVLAYPTIVLKDPNRKKADFIEGVIEPDKLRARIEAFVRETR